MSFIEEIECFSECLYPHTAEANERERETVSSVLTREKKIFSCAVFELFTAGDD